MILFLWKIILDLSVLVTQPETNPGVTVRGYNEAHCCACQGEDDLKYQSERVPMPLKIQETITIV